MKIRKPAAVALLVLAATLAGAQNPYMPLWEYIPDGEPYVFEDPDNPGKQRVYVYGSHDMLRQYYCGRDQVVWSAPVDNLFDWRCDGVIYQLQRDRDGNLISEEGDVLYAPDVAEKVLPDGRKEYYLYPNVQAYGRGNAVAKSDRPDGPFVTFNWSDENPAETVGPFGFDPAILVDDDGRVYGYWGFGESCAAELDPGTMSTVKPGTEVVKGMISGFQEPGVFRFFEASSIRKYRGKYIFVYSRVTADGEFGLYPCNYTLAYAWSDHPLGPWTYGGTIIDARARGLDADGNVIATANPYGNTHGSIQKIGRKWWVFYHRQCGTDEYSRQAMVAPIKVKIRKGAVVIPEAEYTSEGFRTSGLDPFEPTPAGIACYLTNPDSIKQSYPNFIFTGSYVKATRPDIPAAGGTLCPVVNNTAGSVVGYKYFNFRKLSRARNASLEVKLLPQGGGDITVLAGGPDEARGGRVIAEIPVEAAQEADLATVTVPCGKLRGLRGKQPLFFSFSAPAPGVPVCELHEFKFVLR